jgi:hypothetical protein
VGRGSFTAAVLERLDATPPGVAVENRDHDALDEMLAIASQLAEILPDATSGAPDRNPLSRRNPGAPPNAHPSHALP